MQEMFPVAPIGSVALLPTASTGDKEICLACIVYKRQKVCPITFLKKRGLSFPNVFQELQQMECDTFHLLCLVTWTVSLNCGEGCITLTASGGG